MVVANSDWEMLFDVVRQMAETRTLEPLLTYATEQALALIGAEYGYLVLLNDDNTLDFRVQFSRAGTPVGDPREQISVSILQEVIASAEPLLSANAQTDARLQGSSSVRGLKIHSVMCLPLIARGNLLGVLYIDNRSGSAVFDEATMRRMHHFASQAAVSIHNAMLNDELQARVAARTARLEEMNIRLRMLSRAVEQSTNAIAITDTQGIIEYVNPAMSRITGYTPDEVIGQTPQVLQRHPIAPDQFAQAQQAIAQGDEWHGEVRNHRKDGTAYWAALTLSPIKNSDGDVTHFLAVMDDITARKAAEDARRESEQRLELALVGGSHGLWDWNLQTGDVVRNTRWAEMLGYTPDEIPSHINALETYCHPDDLAAVRQRYAAHLKGRLPFYDAEYRLRTKSGDWLWVHDRGQVVERDADGTPLRMTGTQHDITPRKQAERALQTAHDRLAVLQQVDFELARKLAVDYVARIALNAAVQLSGADAGLIGIPIDDAVRLVHATGEYINEIGARIPSDNGITARVVREREPILVRDVSNHPDYFERIASTRAQMTLPLMSGERFAGVLSLETSDPAQFDDDTFSFVKLLCARIAVALDNAQAYEELEHLVNELDAFADTVAHDLKNPLSLITGYVGLITTSTPEELTPQLLENSLQRIHDNALKMADIIDALLLLAGVRKAEDARITILDMDSIMDEVQLRLATLLKDTGGTITLPHQWPDALGYTPWVEQVWINYVSNALKYGGRPPLVELGADELAHGMVRFWVRDNGPGLSAEQQTRVFIPFTRLSDRKVEGHGLGLSIVQRIVTKLGGEVGVESEPGSGSVFSFTLPAAAQKPAPSN